jgi:hypothetical protein
VSGLFSFSFRFLPFGFDTRLGPVCAGLAGRGAVSFSIRRDSAGTTGANEISIS